MALARLMSLADLLDNPPVDLSSDVAAMSAWKERQQFLRIALPTLALRVFERAAPRVRTRLAWLVEEQETLTRMRDNLETAVTELDKLSGARQRALLTRVAVNTDIEPASIALSTDRLHAVMRGALTLVRRRLALTLARRDLACKTVTRFEIFEGANRAEPEVVKLCALR